MFEQLTQLVQQFGQDDVVKNNAVPNEQNDAVMQEAGSSIFSSLQKMASEGGEIEKLAGLLQGNNAQNGSNPAVQEITQQLTGSLGEKFGLDSSTASGVAGSIIPKVLGGLVNKANDPNDSFQITDLIGAISGGGAQTSGIMDTISKYGTQFGLDQNADGKLDLSDAIAATQNKGGIGGFLGKLFGK